MLFVETSFPFQSNSYLTLYEGRGGGGGGVFFFGVGGAGAEAGEKRHTGVVGAGRRRAGGAFFRVRGGAVAMGSHSSCFLARGRDFSFIIS